MGRHSHIWRVVALLAVGLALALVLRWLLAPAGFDSARGFRAENLLEIASQSPRHQGEAVCGTCHDEVLAIHGKDIHAKVECEVCHGSGADHVAYYLEDDAGLPDSAAVMPKEYTLEGCLFCHRKLAARPRDFPQVDPADHYRFLHVTDPATPCVACHSPHEPLFLLTAVEEARLHPLIRECDECHESEPAESHEAVEDHPTLFLCGDCHPAVTRDFTTRQHASLRCTACHLFHRENESSGRIFKNGNRRFCLLCHEARPFRDGDALPLVVSREHLPEMAEAFGKNAGDLERDPRACLSCHYEYLHDQELIEKRGVLSDE